MTLRTSKGAASLVLTWALAATSCVDTSVDVQERELPCRLQAGPRDLANSVVWMSVIVGDNLIRHCSGVAISTRFVITTFSCVAYPGDRARGDAVSEPRLSREPDNYFDPEFFTDFCDTDGNWLPTEDGSLRSRLLNQTSAEAIKIGFQGESSAVLGVDAVLTTSASSRCSDGLAILFLRDSLNTPRTPLRLDDTGREGELVLLSGTSSQPGRFVGRTFEASVDGIALGRAMDSVPPHSLSLSPAACQYDRGGAVISLETGALVAIINSGEGIMCESTQGSTFALRLAPFRGFLLESAKLYSQDLFSELRPHASADDACVLEGEAAIDSD